MHPPAPPVSSASASSAPGPSDPVAALAARVRAAAADKTPLRIRGGGSKDFYGRARAAAVLDTRALRGILCYEPTELVVQARAGTPLAEIEDELAREHQCLPFEPPHFAPAGIATLGGMVAAGFSGPARASVGAVRDFVLGVELINGRGQVLRYGGQVMKNVAGYDIARLLCGSWGTLGVLTEVSLKVLPLPAAEATLRFACRQQQALDWLNAWGGQPLPLNASRWQARAADDGADPEGVLHLRLRGAQAAVQAACRKLGGELLDAAQAAADWQACREQQLPWFAARPARHALWRLALPQTAPALALPAGCGSALLEWHGGLRWVQAPGHMGAALRALAQAHGGSAALFRAADADTPAPPADDGAAPDAALALLHARIRQAFDPAGIFNPGRLDWPW